MKDNNILDKKYINSISDAKNKLIKELKERNDCSNLDRYENMEEAENYVMLSIFNNNIHDIQDILNNKTHSEICSSQNFIKQCVSLYKIKSFRKDYEVKRSNEWIKYNLPELSSSPDKNINIEECISQTNGKGLDSDNAGLLDRSTSFIVPTKMTEPAGKTVPTALGTIAGVSSVLALLYKVITNFYLNI
ncbi:hypothetical protein PCYB_007820 [Plasmodium cynomolgi strain B]|uniref:Uncharacterized protein n=1 Tax=Plasmodium cynomolgi (strain B) TaxID=1120755 RepID=K6UP32_PLACD|nr:hypothetical protein PCYB_007820 [Plasmodium cynomolgi strain B]GAB70033.1 hypothetical protein PCYB_007820 [Plasmodium cynomolgi strain B]